MLLAKVSQNLRKMSDKDEVHHKLYCNNSIPQQTMDAKDVVQWTAFYFYCSNRLSV